MSWTRRENINYTWEHKKAFRKVEKEILGKNTIRGFFHDTEKLFLYLIVSDETTNKIHRFHARHHDNKRTKTKSDYLQMIIDWECARITKPDKPLNAYDTLYKFYPHLENKILPILKELGLDYPTKY